MIENIKYYLLDLGITKNILIGAGLIYLIIAIIVFFANVKENGFWGAFWMGVFWPVIAGLWILSEI